MHFGNRFFEVNVAAFDTKPVNQETINEDSHLLVTRAGHKLGNGG